MSDVTLKDLYIGNIDGETESSRENFEELFYTKNSKYKEILSPEKFIIAGRKGTGKTILARYMKKKLSSEGGICKIYDKEDFKLQKLIDIQNRGLAKEEMSLFWKWVFLKQIADILLESNKFKSKVPFSPIYNLKKFIISKYTDDIYKIRNLSTSQTKKSNLGGKLKLKNQVNPELSSALEQQSQTSKSLINKEYYELLQHLQSLVLKALTNSNDIILIYDDLDELEKKVEKDEGDNQTLISMLETIKTLNQWLINVSKKSKIVVLLRSDIINQIHKDSSNTNKFVENIVELNWIGKNYNSPHQHPLMEMIIHKVQQTNDIFKNMSNEAIYKQLFPKNIYDKDVIDYLLNYSFGRPRDIIRYLKLIIEKYPDEYSFDPDYFKDCLHSYSKWFYNELENEISIHDRKESIHDGLRLINDYKKRTFNLSMIDSYFSQNFTNYPNISSLKETLTDLYKLGVLGNSWKHGKDGYRTSWGYKENASSEPIYTKSFVVHFGFRKQFSL